MLRHSSMQHNHVTINVELIAPPRQRLVSTHTCRHTAPQYTRLTRINLCDWMVRLNHSPIVTMPQTHSSVFLTSPEAGNITLTLLRHYYQTKVPTVTNYKLTSETTFSNGVVGQHRNCLCLDYVLDSTDAPGLCCRSACLFQYSATFSGAFTTFFSGSQELCSRP